MGRAPPLAKPARERVKRPTRRQQALAEAAADPSHATVRDVARAAGYKDYESARKSLHSPHVQAAVAKISAAKGTSALSILTSAKALIATGVSEVSPDADAYTKVEIGAKAALSAAAILERVPSESAPVAEASPRALGRALVRAYLAGLCSALPSILPVERAPISARIDRVSAYLSR